MKALVAMSGGVDSAAAAVLLKRQGYKVEGVTLDLFKGATDIINDAKQVCRTLDIPFHLLELKDVFKTKVIDTFVCGYVSGSTPNPCVDCNKAIKFGALFDYAMGLGFDYLATGHYAEVVFDSGNDKYLLKRPADKSKDQTYVLYSLTQEKLARVLFPLADLTKGKARELAAEHGLLNAQKPDSQDICFIEDGDYAGFIERNIPQGVSQGEGDFIDTAGNVLGRHKGLIHYTIGQTKRLGMSFGERKYVLNKCGRTNTVTVANEKDLYVDTFTAGNINLISIEKIPDKMPVTVKTRYNQAAVPAVISQSNEKITAELLLPQKAITPGQAAVFYDGDVVVGGGTIL